MAKVNSTSSDISTSGIAESYERLKELNAKKREIETRIMEKSQGNKNILAVLSTLKQYDPEAYEFLQDDSRKFKFTYEKDADSEASYNNFSRTFTFSADNLSLTRDLTNEEVILLVADLEHEIEHAKDNDFKASLQEEFDCFQASKDFLLDMKKKGKISLDKLPEWVTYSDEQLYTSLYLTYSDNTKLAYSDDGKTLRLSSPGHEYAGGCDYSDKEIKVAVPMFSGQ